VHACVSDLKFMRPEEDRSPSDEHYAEGGETLVALVASDLPDDAALPLVDGAVRQTQSDLEDWPAVAPRRPPWRYL